MKAPEQTIKNPRQRGTFARVCGTICASTAGGESPTAGDFRNLVIEEPKMQRIYSGTRARVRATPAVCPSMLASQMGGGA